MENYSFITQEELRSLLYYQGAVEKIQLNSSELELRKFYSINNAYETINMLLFPGIENEKSRLWTEKRRIDEQILDNMDELLNVYGNLYAAMCKYTRYKSEHRQDEATIFTYRDDRRHTYVCMENGENSSFLSTSKVMDREPPVDGSVKYFQKKDGLVLMDIEAQDTLEHIDLNDVLGEQSGFPDEEEILYPPFLYLFTEQLLLTEKEKELKDYQGHPPYGKFRVVLKGSTIAPKNLDSKECKELEKIKKELSTQDEINNIKVVWSTIQAGEEAKYSQEIEQYIQWKSKLRLYLREIYGQIKFDAEQSYKDDQREKMFYEDLSERIEKSNQKREQYEKQLQKFSLVEILTGGIAGFCLSLTMIDIDVISVRNVNIDCKVLVLLAVTICIMLAAICKSMALKEKLQQRTEAFLDYDMLRTDWIYEQEKTENNLNRYIRRMHQIEERENQRCVQYTDHKIQAMSAWEDEVGKLKDTYF